MNKILQKLFYYFRIRNNFLILVASDKDSLQSNILPSSSESSTRSAPSTLATTNRPFHVNGHVSHDDAIKSEIKSGS